MAHRLPNAQQLTPAAAAAAKETSWPADWGMPCGVWEQLRVLSYNSDDFFLPHRDNACAVGHSSLLPACQSHTSMLLYLADSVDGSGATRFYLDAIETSGADAPSRPTSGAVVDVVPWAGRAVVFPHRMLHESMQVVEGRKLVMRGDVLFK